MVETDIGVYTFRPIGILHREKLVNCLKINEILAEVFEIALPETQVIQLHPLWPLMAINS